MNKGIILALAASFGTALASELTLKTADLELSFEVGAQAVPKKYHAISLTPKKWGTMVVKSVLPQGSKVKAGETLVKLDTEGLEKEIAKQQKEQISRVLNLEGIKQDYEDLKASTKLGLEKAQHEFDRKKEDYDRAMKELIPQAKKDAKQMVKNEEHWLEYAKEEFTQLKKMYAEDDLTEETEEIILKRTKRDVERRERSLKKAQLESNWILNTKVKREEQDWKLALHEAKTKLNSEQKKLARALKQKKEFLDKETKTVQDWVEHLASLRSDLKHLQVSSPADGIVYYGNFEKGVWDASEAQKMLVQGGKIIPQRTIITVVPAETAFKFVGLVDAKQRAFLNKGDAASVKLHGSLAKTDLKVSKVAAQAQLGGKWAVEFSGNLAQGSFVQAGTPAKLKVMAVHKEDVLSVPHSALSFDEKGQPHVSVKLEDDTFEAREVTLGEVSDSKVELTSGVTAGQVIMMP